jgi:hypothetical protein
MRFVMSAEKSNNANLIVEAETIVEALAAGDESRARGAFVSAVGKIDAAPERAVENVEEFWNALRAAGATHELIDEIAEDIRRSVSREVEQTLAAAWRPKQ